MGIHVIIDGNNLLHAMHAHAPLPHVGRETMAKVIDRWARQAGLKVTLVLDGPIPPEGLAAQMSSSRVTARFSAPESADDVIARMIHQTRDPGKVRIISSDTALRHEALRRRCGFSDSVAFIDELFADVEQSSARTTRPGEKPEGLSPDETDEWLETFGLDDDDEPFDGHDAMTE